MTTRKFSLWKLFIFQKGRPVGTEQVSEATPEPAKHPHVPFRKIQSLTRAKFIRLMKNIAS